MTPLILTRLQARRFLLAHQGLWPPHNGAGASGALAYIRRVNCIQFDPLNIAGRNAELTLQARVADFRPAMLDTLLYAERRLLDGWDKVMSIYPVEDWPYFRRYREAERQRLGHDHHPIAEVLPAVRAALAARGPLSSLELDFEQRVNWPWGPTRISRAALESMYAWGELIIHHKVNTRKVYDFAARHLPAELLAAPDPNASDEQFNDWRVLRRIGGIGLIWNKSGDAWIGLDLKSGERAAALKRLLAQGTLREATVEGLSVPLYLRSADLPALERAQIEVAPRAAILAPLDNLLWERRLVEALFGFVYRWEVYKPAAEREYGYYVLPILYGDRFVARFEPGRDKKTGALVIKNWWWETNIEVTHELQAELRACFARFCAFLGAATLQLAPAAMPAASWLP